MPIDQASLAGYAASEGEPLVIDDVYVLPPDVEYAFNRSFDQRYGYRTKSMLVIPMVNHHGEVIGVLQLINRKRDFAARLATPEEADRQIISYSPHTVKLVPGAGRSGRGVNREQPALRGDRAIVRGIRDGCGHRDRAARPDDLGPFGTGRHHDRRAGDRWWTGWTTAPIVS